MSTIYIVSDFGKLVKQGKVLKLKKFNDTINTIFPFKTEQLVIMGQIEITAPALRLLMHHNIDTIFLGTNGRFNGKIAFQSGKNVLLRKKQFLLTDDEEFKVSVSKSIVKAKLQNQFTFMQRIARNSKNPKSLKKSLNHMKDTIKKVDYAKTTDSLRGYEGYGAKVYFSVFGNAIKADWAEFKGRNMHPPRDNVNAVLSFLYTLLLFRVDAAVQTSGLDPYAGYLHTPDYGKKALVFDLLEEYRTPLVDTLTVSLFNLGILKQDDFRTQDFSTESDEYPLEPNEKGEVVDIKTGVLLTKDGIRKIIPQLERKLETSFYYEPLLRKITYKQLIYEQVKAFKRRISGESSVYKAFSFK